MKKFILFLLVAFTCIACEPRKEQAYSKHSGTMDIDTVTIHGIKHEFIYNYGKRESGITHSPECWCLKKWILDNSVNCIEF